MGTTPIGPARRRRHDRSEMPVSFLPEGNPPARRAYLFALFGLIPALGLVCGPAAMVFAVLGRKAARQDEFERGKGHARFSLVAGAVEFACSAAGFLCLSKGAGWL